MLRNLSQRFKTKLIHWDQRGAEKLKSIEVKMIKRLNENKKYQKTLTVLRGTMAIGGLGGFFGGISWETCKEYNKSFRNVHHILANGFLCGSLGVVIPSVPYFILTFPYWSPSILGFVLVSGGCTLIGLSLFTIGYGSGQLCGYTKNVINSVIEEDRRRRKDGKEKNQLNVRKENSSVGLCGGVCAACGVCQSEHGDNCKNK